MKAGKHTSVTDLEEGMHPPQYSAGSQSELVTARHELPKKQAEHTPRKRARYDSTPFVKTHGALYRVDMHQQSVMKNAVKHHNLAFLIDLREQLSRYPLSKEAQSIIKEMECFLMHPLIDKFQLDIELEKHHRQKQANYHSLPHGLKSALITDSRLFPRCEFHSRFHGTTVFAMAQCNYWGTYHRSAKTRFADNVRKFGNKAFTIQNPNIHKKYTGMISISSHAGGIMSQLSDENYRRPFEAEKKRKTGSGRVNMHDELLIYKRRMCDSIRTNFYKMYRRQQEQPTGPENSTDFNIIRNDNGYPCVLISLPVNKPEHYKTTTKDWVSYWHEKNAQFQELLTCLFIAYININAQEEQIPIEMILRSSFGHNNPSASNTGETFRINPGLIPFCYAQLIAKTLVVVINTLHNIDDGQGEYRLTAEQDRKYKEYYYHKLRIKIRNKPDLQDLKKLDCYRDGFTEQNLSQLYRMFNQHPSSSAICVQPTLAEGMCAWEAIRQRATTGGKNLLYEVFRKRGAKDLFINRLMHSISCKTKYPIQHALGQMINELELKVNLDTDGQSLKALLHSPNLSNSISDELQKKFFTSPSFEPIYRGDVGFFDIIRSVMHSLHPHNRPRLKQPPLFALYAMLELAGIEFALQHICKAQRNTRAAAQTAIEFGSDSDSEIRYEPAPRWRDKSRLYHKKIRVCSGMKAILIAHLAALSHFKKTSGASRTTLSIDCSRMYYETSDAIKLVKLNQEFKIKFIKSIDEYATASTGFLIYYDLNHNNSTNINSTQEAAAAAIDRRLRLASPKPKVMILDTTSALMTEILQSVKSCFNHQQIEVVLCVNSGLKNSQAGSDFNPYGEIRIFTRKRPLTTKLRTTMIQALRGKNIIDTSVHAEEQSEHPSRLQLLIDKANESSPEGLSEQTHSLVRLYKSRGHAQSIKYRTDKRHAVTL